jgi:hypothetical protein
MKIVQYLSKDLISAEYNPRQLTKEQYNQLKDSIKRFGLVDPIIVNRHNERKNIVVGGHQRLLVAKDLKIDTVPCVEVNLSLEKEKELNIRLNKNIGGWDYDALANFFDVEELKDWGFSEKSLLGLFDEVDYSILEDDDVSDLVDDMRKGTRKSILVEFNLEDYDEAVKIYQTLNGKFGYMGGEVLRFFKQKLKEK